MLPTHLIHQTIHRVTRTRNAIEITIDVISFSIDVINRTFNLVLLALNAVDMSIDPILLSIDLVGNAFGAIGVSVEIVEASISPIVVSIEGVIHSIGDVTSTRNNHISRPVHLVWGLSLSRDGVEGQEGGSDVQYSHLFYGIYTIIMIFYYRILFK